MLSTQRNDRYPTECEPLPRADGVSAHVTTVVTLCGDVLVAFQLSSEICTTVVLVFMLRCGLKIVLDRGGDALISKASMQALLDGMASSAQCRAVYLMVNSPLVPTMKQNAIVCYALSRSAQEEI